MNYKCKIEDISKMLKHQRNMKKIKKECMKNMIAGPGLLQEEQLKKVKLHKQSYSNQKKLESLASQTKKHKNSAVYSHPTYNSD